MSSRRPVPIRNLATRLPDAGRIRIGIKVPMSGLDKRGRPKSRPEKLDTFRFTSQDKAALEQVASIYGGTASEWDEPKAAPGQWQVITEAKELRIALPPDPLGNTPIYEMWGGAGCERRCDAETCEMITKGPDGLDLQQVPCICDRKQVLECKLKTRLSVVLPDIRFGGVWRLDTGSNAAAEELPGMVNFIRGLQDKGIVRATMRVEWRKQVVAGQTNEFAVPVLGVDASPDELVAGQARLGALGTASQPAGELSTGATEVAPQPPAVPSPDDEVVDAELVEDEDRTISAGNRDRLIASCEGLGLATPDVVFAGTEGRTADPADVLVSEIPAVKQARDDLHEKANADTSTEPEEYAPDDPGRPFEPAGQHEPPYPDPDTGADF